MFERVAALQLETTLVNLQEPEFVVKCDRCYVMESINNSSIVVVFENQVSQRNSLQQAQTT